MTVPYAHEVTDQQLTTMGFPVEQHSYSMGSKHIMQQGASRHIAEHQAWAAHKVRYSSHAQRADTSAPESKVHTPEMAAYYQSIRETPTEANTRLGRHPQYGQKRNPRGGKTQEAVPATTHIRPSRVQNIDDDRLLRRSAHLDDPAVRYDIAYNAPSRKRLREVALESQVLRAERERRGISK